MINNCHNEIIPTLQLLHKTLSGHTSPPKNCNKGSWPATPSDILVVYELDISWWDNYTRHYQSLEQLYLNFIWRITSDTSLLILVGCDQQLKLCDCCIRYVSIRSYNFLNPVILKDHWLILCQHSCRKWSVITSLQLLHNILPGYLTDYIKGSPSRLVLIHFLTFSIILICYIIVYIQVGLRELLDNGSNGCKSIIQTFPAYTNIKTYKSCLHNLIRWWMWEYRWPQYGLHQSIRTWHSNKHQ